MHQGMSEMIETGKDVDIEDLQPLFAECADIEEIQTQFKFLLKKYHPVNFDKEDKTWALSVCEKLQDILELYQSGDLLIGAVPLAVRSSLINYSKYREMGMTESWEDHWDFRLSYGENVRRLIDRFVKLPHAEIQVPIAAAFACQNLPLLHKASILCCYGREGSGKSTLAKLQGCLSGVYQSGSIVQASSTFASVRNYIESEREWPLRDRETGKKYEKNLVLVWDDLTPQIIKDERIYNLLKAYDRSTAYIKLARQGEDVGSTQSFFVFALKVISSVTPFFAIPQFRELTRRTFYIHCKRMQVAPSDEIPQLEDVNWSGLENEFYSAWNDEAIVHYQEMLKIRRPSTVNLAEWEISRSLIASGIALGVWNDKYDARADLEAYWEFTREQSMKHQSPTELVLDALISEWRKDPQNQESGVTDQISTKFITWGLKEKHREGQLENTPTPQRVHAAMEALGWKITRIGGVNFYVPVD
jgi:energy-coupling factor transporter ATP-binding protein EcfA2